MAKIRADDVVEVRERARLDEVVRDVVALKPSGGGSYKGLCPFHDERSPSFQVSPAKGLWYCFGCGEGGDTIDFVRRIDSLTFAEAVEKLAGRYGVELHYEQGGGAVGRMQGERTRLVTANTLAAEFFVAALATPAAEIARDFLTGRGFDEELIATFGVGFAPQSWDALVGHLRNRGVGDEDILAAGLAAVRDRGPYDRFRGRVVWPIRDLAGDVVGFGARKLFDDDGGPKYLNTPETPLYKKSHVLFGVDVARRAIANSQQAVIVEGYTDVMACHAAGVTNAVATCGTAFGGGHVKVLRRLMFDADALSGEIVFTFDGDAAGQRAAMRTLESEQEFVAQTFVAVEPGGMDPCDLRLTGGDEAVRGLVAGRVPLVEFAMRSTLAELNLDSAEGRIAGLRATAPMISSIRDEALRAEYATRLAGWIGVDQAAVRAAGRAAGRTGGRAGSRAAGGRASGQTSGQAGARPHDEVGGRQPQQTTQRSGTQRPNMGGSAPADQRLEAQALQVMLQHPYAVAEWIEVTEPSAFTVPAALPVFAAIRAVPPPADEAGVRGWLEEVLAAAVDDEVRSGIRRWAVLGLPLTDGADVEAFGQGIMARLHALDVERRIVPMKARLARMGSQTEPDDVADLLGQLMELEKYRRELYDLASGEN